ncbi:MAG: ABC transporter permease subunit [Planctomycetes bacterium]|nr:ABC transporter permease subunit [Planctomycetota bacterium]
MAALSGWWDDYLRGALVILQLFGVGIVLVVVFGLVGATLSLSRSAFARRLARLYAVVFRGTPELLVLLIVYFGSAVTLTAVARFFDPSVRFLDVPPFWAGALALGLVVGAYASETFRGAFTGVDAGQLEAARALGLNRAQTFVYVRLPQMWRLALPSFGNHMLSLMKDTALVSIIGVEEILFTAEMATSVTSKPFTMYFAVAVIYLAIAVVITALVAGLERFANRHLRSGR